MDKKLSKMICPNCLIPVEASEIIEYYIQDDVASFDCCGTCDKCGTHYIWTQYYISDHCDNIEVEEEL